MAMNFSVEVRNARGLGIVAAIDVTGAGTIDFFDGTRPAAGGAETNKLGTCALSVPSGVVANGLLTFSPIGDDLSADADGIITWARFKDSNGNYMIDVGCGIAGSGEEIVFNDTTVITGGSISITSASILEGNV